MPFESGQISLLRELYLENDYPSDRLIRDRNALLGFTNEFNGRAKSSYSEEVVAAELERLRKGMEKTGGLPRLGRKFSGPKYVLNTKSATHAAK